ncbi:MAG: hypothetical protein JO256_04410 [Alphaproteobacteria bacterium]|nr:hypothetical protein [Alphaproteobacteria bacterium]
MSKPALQRYRRLRRNVLLLCLLTLLTGCAHSVDVAPPQLPDEPPGLTACTDEPVPGLPGATGQSWDTAAVVGIIGDQRSSALAKDRCGHDWRDFYNDLVKRMAGK